LFCRYTKGESPSDVEIIVPTIPKQTPDIELERCFIKKEDLFPQQRIGHFTECLVKVAYAKNLGYSIRIGIKNKIGEIIQFEVPRDSIQDFILSSKSKSPCFLFGTFGCSKFPRI